MTSTPTQKHTFNRAADATIAKANEISSMRGGEYQDSWAIENLKTTFLDNLLAAHPHGQTPEWKRLVVMASIIDVKLSRLNGAWKEDTTVDLINYVAAYTHLRNEYEMDLCKPSLNRP